MTTTTHDARLIAQRRASLSTPGTALHWSERGRIACADHAPMKGSDAWRYERWAAMFPNEVGAARAKLRIAEPLPLCERCRARFVSRGMDSPQ